ncbi:uncharacterized protein LOC128958327 [Oppia nitens]|uniref:uncharacterized protein LOC128958327 n=1 Tax=Oppia nitens TaxID=1686743 RepID=UPI0023DC39C4|nr:uncharacterized protein LOC128958327 [Oppia nitens]
MDQNKSFIFGKNYDSDYLSGRRLNRNRTDTLPATVGHKKIFAKKHNPYDKRKTARHSAEAYDTLAMTSKYLPKTSKRRLILKPVKHEKTLLEDQYQQNNGIFLNGKASKVVDRNQILLNRQQFKARIQEDLSWILNKQRKMSSKTLSRPLAAPQKLISKVSRRTVFNEKATQMTNSPISSSIYLSDDYNDTNINECQYFNGENPEDRRRLSQTKVHLNNANKEFIRVTGKTNYMNNTITSTKVIDGLKNSDTKANLMKKTTTNVVMPTVPSILTIVNNLMNSYEEEKKTLEKRDSHFAENFINKISDFFNGICIANKQSIEDNFVYIQNQSLVGSQLSVMLSTSMSERSTKSVVNTKDVIDNRRDILTDTSLVPYTGRSLDANRSFDLMNLEPKVGNMFSNMLLNISEAFQTLSSKYKDKSFDK